MQLLPCTTSKISRGTYHVPRREAIVKVIAFTHPSTCVAPEMQLHTKIMDRSVSRQRLSSSTSFCRPTMYHILCTIPSLEAHVASDRIDNPLMIVSSIFRWSLQHDRWFWNSEKRIIRETFERSLNLISVFESSFSKWPRSMTSVAAVFRTMRELWPRVLWAECRSCLHFLRTYHSRRWQPMSDQKRTCDAPMKAMAMESEEIGGYGWWKMRE